MKPKTFLIILLILLIFSCEKESDESIKTYYTGGYISFNIEGQYKGYEIKDSQSFTFYSNYQDSYITTEYSDGYQIFVDRFSEKFESKVALSILFDPLHNYKRSGRGIRFSLAVQKKNNLIIELNSLNPYDATDTIPYIENQHYFQFSDINFSEEKKTISGDFLYNTNTTDVENKYVIEGSFEAQLFERIW